MVEMFKNRLVAAFRAFGIHLALSLLVALIAATVVLQLWFPFPYRILAGGNYLFWLMAIINVICGPLLTALLYSPAKSRRELMLDLFLVALIQVAALVYGFYSIAQARPVVLAFETDRMVVVSAAQVERHKLYLAPAQFHSLSWSTPVLVGTRTPNDSAEMLRGIEMSMQGLGPSLRPDWWQNYEESRPLVKQRMKKLADLHATLAVELQVILDKAVRESGLQLSQIFYLPLTSQKVLEGWIVLLDENANIVGYAAVDGF